MSSIYPLKCRLVRNSGEPGVTRVDVYDDIGDYGWFGGLSAQDFASQMAAISGDIECHINSGGGDVFDGVAIANALRNHKGGVTTVVDGIAASIASVIAQAGRDRVVQDGSMLMIHEPFSMCAGDAADMAKESEILDKVAGNLASIYADRAGGTPGKWRDEMRKETWYTAEEAVAAGLADRVGAAAAELPPGLDVAAFTSVPGRIAARLRSMPVAKAPERPKDAAHPHDGEHSHSHSAYGAADGDDDGMHTHPHSHSGDGSHDHSHARPPASGSTGARPSGGDQSCEALGHQCCKDAAAGADLAALLTPEFREAVQKIAAAQGDGMHKGHKRVDPDGDGDCDACPEGDTDNDYWSEDGEPIRPLPDPDGDDTGVQTDAMGHRIRGAAVDESDWDGPAAMSAASKAGDPAAALSAICAGKREGDPKTQEAHALPHHKHPGDPPNRHGVSNAMSRLSSTEGLTNRDDAERHLKAHQAVMGGDDGRDAGDSASTELTDEQYQQVLAALKGAAA